MEGFLNLISGYFGGGFSLTTKPYPYRSYRWGWTLHFRYRTKSLVISRDEPSTIDSKVVGFLRKVVLSLTIMEVSLDTWCWTQLCFLKVIGSVRIQPRKIMMRLFRSCIFSTWRFKHADGCWWPITSNMKHEFSVGLRLVESCAGWKFANLQVSWQNSLCFSTFWGYAKSPSLTGKIWKFQTTDSWNLSDSKAQSILGESNAADGSGGGLMSEVSELVRVVWGKAFWTKNKKSINDLAAMRKEIEFQP